MKGKDFKRRLLIGCMLLSGYCGIVSELSLFNLGTVLMGGTNRTLLYTMGVMMFFMGIGSALTGLKCFQKPKVEHFAVVELLLSVFTMSSAAMIYSLSSQYPLYILPFFLFFSIWIGLLIGMEIPLILRLNETLGLNLQSNSARVMMADYFGSLLAFALFPFVLFPQFGVIHSAFSGGVLNLSLAVFTLIIFREQFQNLLRYVFFTLAVSGFCVWLGFSLESWSAAAENRLFRDPIVFARNTHYQSLIFTLDEPGRKDSYTRRMKDPGKTMLSYEEDLFQLKKFNEFNDDFRFFINGGLQFSTVDEYRYHETLVHPLLSLVPDADRVMILGGGDGLAAREVLKHENIQQILLVDLDKQLTDLFRFEKALVKINKGSLQSEKVTVVNEDAFVFLRNLKERFPVVIVDFPDPHCMDTAKLYSQEFFELLRHSITEDGVFCIQSSSPLFTRKVFLSIGKTLASAGLNVVPAHINMKTFEEWGFYFGSPSRSKMQLKEKLAHFQPKVSTRYLNNDALQAALLFGKDVFFDLSEIPVNRLDRLILADLYREQLW